MAGRERLAKPPRTLILTRYPVYADSLRALLEAAGIATEPFGSLIDLLSFLTSHRKRDHTVVLLAGIPPMVSYSDFLGEVVQKCRGSPVVLLTGDRDPRHVSEAVRLGIKGYLTSSQTDGWALAHAVQLVARGLTVLGVGPHPLHQGSLTQRGRRTSLWLTPREREVCGLLARGLTNREIGTELHISLRTVQMHVAQIVAKMAAHSRTDAAIRAANLSEQEREAQISQR